MAVSEPQTIQDSAPDDGRSRHFLKSALTSFTSYGVLALLALFCLFTAAVGDALPVFVVAVLAITGWDTFRLWKKRSRLGHRAVIRALLAVAVGTAYTVLDPSYGALASVAAIAVAGPIFFESLLAKGTNSKETFIRGLPGIRTYGSLKEWDRSLLTASEIVILLGAVIVWTGMGPLPWLIFALVLDALYLVLAVVAFLRIRRNAAARTNLHDAIVAYQPEFYIYTSRPDDASYQVMMWLPYLARTKKKFAIITRNNVPAKALSELTDAPIITCPKSADLEKTLVPSLGAVFYDQILSFHLFLLVFCL